MRPDLEEPAMTNPFAPASPATSFRRLAPGECGRLLPEHFLRLDGEDRRRRFGGHASDERVRAYGARLERHPGDAVDPAATCAAM